MICRIIKKLLFKYKHLEPIREKVYLRFVVLSDTHITPSKVVEQKRLKDVLKACYHLNSNIDAIVIVGDLTDSGKEEEYKAVKSVLDKYIKDNTKLVACMGNHEYNSRELFESIMNLKPRDNVKIEGYHFITLSPRESDTQYGGSRYYLDKEWLETQLKEASEEDEKKPIFVFMHHGIKDTAFGTDEWNTEDLYDVLKNYPQVVHFSGHSHYPLNNPKSIYQKDFTAVNTCTISYFDFPSDIERNIDDTLINDVCQALLVEVKGEDIRIRKLDLISNSYIGDDWTINTAENIYGYKYTEDRKDASRQPFFDFNDKVKAQSVGRKHCILKIDQAKVRGRNDVIEYYKIEFKNTENGTIEVRYKVWAQYAFIPKKKKIMVKCDGLKENSEYEVIVTAYNAYDKSSINTLSRKFKTK